ncbi:MAG: mobile mystery protein A [Proteobacteria bacterium]|nr:mobile mystery protein A [Pseudomonadota bacterium]
MRSTDRALARKQLDKRFNQIRSDDSLTRPPRGWVKAIRQALGMTTTQLATRLGVSQPRIIKIEKAEMEGSITLDSLKRAAQALDCQLVYALIPEKPLNEIVEDRARQLARERLAITGHHMALEAQSISPEDAKAQFEQLVSQIVEKAGSNLWKEER